MLQLTEDLWIAETIQPIAPGLRFPARMLVARLDDGLWIHSPIPIDDALAAELDALGEVRHLVAPNCLHHLHLGPASQRWPAAKVYAPAGLEAKRDDLRIDVILESGAAPWPAFAPVIQIAGADDAGELVFVHRPSKTLILCDLAFNMHAAPNAMTRLVLRLVGVWRRFGQSKVWRRMTRDRGAAGASCAAIFDHEFERIYVSHGDVVEGPNAAAQLRDALAWMLAGHREHGHEHGT